MDGAEFFPAGRGRGKARVKIFGSGRGKGQNLRGGAKRKYLSWFRSFAIGGETFIWI